MMFPQVSSEFEHVRLRQVGLHHHARLARIRHVDGGEVLWRALVREPQDAAAVGAIWIDMPSPMPPKPSSRWWLAA